MRKNKCKKTDRKSWYRSGYRALATAVLIHSTTISNDRVALNRSLNTIGIDWQNAEIEIEIPSSKLSPTVHDHLFYVKSVRIGKKKFQKKKRCPVKLGMFRR